MGQGFDARLQLDERAELRKARDAARAQLPDGIPDGNLGPRIGSELFQAEGDLLRVLVDPHHPDGDFLAWRDQLGRIRHAGPRHLGDVEQALDPRPEIDERAELAHGGDAPGQYGADHDRRADLGGAQPLLRLEQGPPRHDQVPAALPVLDDAERVDVPLVIRRCRVPDQIHLREGTEGALPGDAHLVSALHRLLDLAFHRQARVERVFELAHGCGPARELS